MTYRWTFATIEFYFFWFWKRIQNTFEKNEKKEIYFS